jgi:hypothetical protein
LKTIDKIKNSRYHIVNGKVRKKAREREKNICERERAKM